MFSLDHVKFRTHLTPGILPIYGQSPLQFLALQNQRVIESQNYGLRDWLQLQETIGAHLVQFPLLKHNHLQLDALDYVRVSWTVSRRPLNISKEEHSTTSLGSLSQCLVTLTVKGILPSRSFLDVWRKHP